jgi:pseudouridine-5'-phosphate glycosidase
MVDQRVENAGDVANIAATRDRLMLGNAILVTIPIPEESEVDRESLESILATSLNLATVKGIHGKELTPFLLAEMSEESGGKTLEANIALLKNNAQVAAEIALALC